MVEFGGYDISRAKQRVVSDKHKAMMKDYIDHNITRDDVARQLDAENEAKYWRDFRDHYKPFGEPGEGGELDFAEIPEHTPGVYYDLSTDEFVRRSDGVLPEPAAIVSEPQRSLPEPQVPSSGRGGRDAPRSANPVVRAIRSLGRLFGKG
ncbi:hypothetical protein Toil_gp08 [Rhodococcus phage Toil]|uniref:Uncharacterized protein n=1 Tax=Rhodococcus phage Toil TaxID=1975614 RepID=A0A1W6DXS4_9VIRU|nr:hypothetical protein KMD62_gp08 [Rhodococcus phage Toil]ARK07691.1 hypothetical protein Toil_gp08 [Rhodococcus phage Toil]